MFKFLNLMAAPFIAVSLNAFGAHAKGGSGIPDQAALLFQAIGSTGTAEFTSSAARSTAIHSALGDIKSKVESLETDLEFQCHTVYYDWGKINVHESTNCGSPFQSACYYSAIVHVNVYCLPRDYPQKVAISAERACELEPKPQCMSKEYMDMFKIIENTNYVKIGFPEGM